MFTEISLGPTGPHSRFIQWTYIRTVHWDRKIRWWLGIALKNWNPLGPYWYSCIAYKNVIQTPNVRIAYKFKRISKSPPNDIKIWNKQRRSWKLDIGDLGKCYGNSGKELLKKLWKETYMVQKLNRGNSNSGKGRHSCKKLLKENLRRNWIGNCKIGSREATSERTVIPKPPHPISHYFQLTPSSTLKLLSSQFNSEHITVSPTIHSTLYNSILYTKAKTKIICAQVTIPK